MTSFLFSRGIRIFDYSRFAESLRDRIRIVPKRSVKPMGCTSTT